MTDYLAFIEGLLKENKTSGPNQSDAMIHYTKMNLQRMKRWLKKGELLPETIEAIKGIKQPQKWVLITEAWCGDAAHAYPFIKMMVDQNPLIELEIKLRDENLLLIDQYLTNGGRSIPKLIVYNDIDQELFNWGPRPKFIQDYVMSCRKNNVSYAEYAEKVQQMYNDNKGRCIQKEILDKLGAELKIAC